MQKGQGSATNGFPVPHSKINYFMVKNNNLQRKKMYFILHIIFIAFGNMK